MSGPPSDGLGTIALPYEHSIVLLVANQSWELLFLRLFRVTYVTVIRCDLGVLSPDGSSGKTWVVGDELPAAAAARMAGIGASGTWGSSLTSGEFAAIRSVGFEPVGQVFGAAVFGVAYGDGYSCPRTTALSTAAVEARSSGQLQERDGRGPERGRQRLERVGQRPERAGGDGLERDDHGPLGPLVRAMDQARRTAVERMTAQCAELGGDGVVGLRVSRGSFLLGGQEFTALGTAVRARGAEFTALGDAAQAPDRPDDEAGGAPLSKPSW